MQDGQRPGHDEVVEGGHEDGQGGGDDRQRGVHPAAEGCGGVGHGDLLGKASDDYQTLGID